MNKKKIVNVCSLLINSCLFYIATTSNSSGSFGTANGGCNCHGNSNGGTQISVTGIPNNKYENGNTYTITLSVISSGFVKAGFNINCSAGSFSSTNTDVQFIGGATTGTQITHNGPKTMSAGIASWTFTWTAPSLGKAPIFFNYAGNAVNGNNAPNLDMWNIGSLNLTHVNASTPKVQNASATGITSTTATINALVNAKGDTTTTLCKYGTTLAMSSIATLTPTPIWDTSDQNQSVLLSGLSPNTTYYYQIRATNVNGFDTSSVSSFTTADIPNNLVHHQELYFNLYPNPCADFLIVTHKADRDNITVCDFMGIKVSIEKIRTDETTTTLLLHRLHSGVYLVSDGVVTKAISKR